MNVKTAVVGVLVFVTALAIVFASAPEEPPSPRPTPFVEVTIAPTAEPTARPTLAPTAEPWPVQPTPEPSLTIDVDRTVTETGVVDDVRISNPGSTAREAGLSEVFTGNTSELAGRILNSSAEVLSTNPLARYLDLNVNPNSTTRLLEEIPNNVKVNRLLTKKLKPETKKRLSKALKNFNDANLSSEETDYVLNKTKELLEDPAKTPEQAAEDVEKYSEKVKNRKEEGRPIVTTDPVKYLPNDITFVVSERTVNRVKKYSFVVYYDDEVYYKIEGDGSRPDLKQFVSAKTTKNAGTTLMEVTADFSTLKTEKTFFQDQEPADEEDVKKYYWPFDSLSGTLTVNFQKLGPQQTKAIKINVKVQHEYEGEGALEDTYSIDASSEMNAGEKASSDTYKPYYAEEGTSVPQGAVNKEYICPLDSTTIESYASPNRMHPFEKIVKPHRGVDLAALINTPVKATASGVVQATDENPSGAEGKSIRLLHKDGVTSFYAHLNSISVARGQQVEKGQVIGATGNTGKSTGLHLHFGIAKNGQPTYEFTNSICSANQANREGEHKNIKATIFCHPGDALAGGTVAFIRHINPLITMWNGKCPDPGIDFIALPSKKAGGKYVQITNEKNGNTVVAVVADLGPWCRQDDAYVFGTARPIAEQRRGQFIGISSCNSKYKSNGAGIDLSLTVGQKLTGRTTPREVDGALSTVTWKFVTPPNIGSNIT